MPYRILLIVVLTLILELPAGNVQARGITGAPRQDGEGPGVLACRGNEPFWTLTIDGAEAEYARLTDATQPKPQRLKGALRAREYFKPPLFVWRGRGERASGDMVAMITEEHCLDTMSEAEGQTTFGYTIRVSMPNGELLTGCCAARARDD